LCSIFALIALKTIDNLLEIIISQMTDEQAIFQTEKGSEHLLFYIRRMALASLCGVSIMSDYSDRVWFREMMQLMMMMVLMI
jgi:hypothetical protein